MPREALHEQIQEILDGVVEMLALVERATQDCTRALLLPDLELATSVIDADDVIDALYRRLDERTYEMLATHAPVAADLRAVLATIRMIGDIERAGDLALNIAKITRHSWPLDLPPRARECVVEMDVLARELLRVAAFAVHHRDPDVAERLDLMDDRLDDLRRMLYAGLLTGEWQANRAATVNLPLIARYYERIADHAVSVAERVEFLSTGVAHSAHTGF